MMTLDEAIIHAEEVAEAEERIAKLHQRPDRGIKGSGRRYLSCLECASEHRQLAEWLRELKAYRDTYKNYSAVEKMLICEVEKAKENPSVKKPIAYGLYQTWKFWDKNEVAREANADAEIHG